MENMKLIDIENKERSVLTKKKLETGETFFLIPKKLLIMSPEVEKSKIGSNCIRFITQILKLVITIQL